MSISNLEYKTPLTEPEETSLQVSVLYIATHGLVYPTLVKME